MKAKLQLCFLIILTGLCVAGWEYYDFNQTEVVAMEAEERGKEQEIEGKQAELRRLQEFAQNIEQIKLELRELNLQLESALEHMPKTFNLSGLLRKLSMLAQNSGLELFTFRPAPGEEKSSGTFYSTIGINFDIKGSFTQVLLFLDQIARLKRIINTEELRMTPDGAVTQKGAGPLLSVSAKVKTYRFSE